MVVACFSFTIFIRSKYLGIQEFDLILFNRVLGNLARNDLNSVNLLRWPTGKKVTGFFLSMEGLCLNDLARLGLFG